MSYNPGSSSQFSPTYDDRFHQIMYPVTEQTIPRVHNNLATDDISGASPGSTLKNLKKITGRDYMNIRDIPGVNPSPDFITYKSKHKDYKLDISDIVSGRSKTKPNLLQGLNKNPLEPQYLRMTESRRHVHVYGDIDGNKPKQFIAPKTRRKTNMIDDINGAKAKVNMPIPKFQPSEHRQRQTLSQNKRLNPITGEEYYIDTDYPKPVSFLKEDNSDKSRRLARILKSFKNSNNGRSRSNLKLNLNQMPSNSPISLNPKLNPQLVSTRDPTKLPHQTRENGENLMYSSKDVKPVELPAFSQRKLGHNNSSNFHAYEDMAPVQKPEHSRRSRIDKTEIKNVSQSFTLPDRSEEKEINNRYIYLLNI